MMMKVNGARESTAALYKASLRHTKHFIPKSRHCYTWLMHSRIMLFAF